MTTPFGHQALHNRYLFEAILTLETPLRVSSGRASDLTDAPLMRNRAGVPYIPGSSLRGVLRSEVERILAAAGQAVGLRSCTLFTHDDGDDACMSASRSKQEKVNEFDEEHAALQFVEQHLCEAPGATVSGTHCALQHWPGHWLGGKRHSLPLAWSAG